MNKLYSLRPATESDFPEILALIQDTRINPTGLDWRRFTVADNGSVVIACGQLKPVPGGLTELASIVVRSEFRKKGIARDLIRHLLAGAPRPLYLTCRSALGGFYEKFGFRSLEMTEMPKYYRRLVRLADIYFKLKRQNEALLVMKLG